MQDVIIVGGGPAGMTASIYAARKKLDVLMISPDVGGQTAWAADIENYLGYFMINGFDLATKFEEHVKQFNVPLCKENVTSLEIEPNSFKVKTESGKEYEGKTVIVCSGRSARNLGVPGEEEYKGRGVAYCATCDAPLFADEDVAVVGGGNAGLSAAIQLVRIAKQVYLIEELSHLTGDKSVRDLLANAPNVEVMTDTEVKCISGNKMVKGITVRGIHSKVERDIPVAGIFVEIGSMPNTKFVPKEVAMNNWGEIEIDCSGQTNVPGFFAAGDATNIPHKQIIIAAGEGAKALLSAYDYMIHTAHHL